MDLSTSQITFINKGRSIWVINEDKEIQHNIPDGCIIELNEHTETKFVITDMTYVGHGVTEPFESLRYKLIGCTVEKSTIL